MLDNRLMQALAAVVQEGGFEKAASRLHITQSAVSQRIRSLEDAMGQPLLVRASPVRPTEAGQRLLAHYRRVRHLEDDLLATFRSSSPSDAMDTPVVMPLAVNEDSLATWFLPVLRPFLASRPVLLDIYTDDQEVTHALLRTGVVTGCISSLATPIQGCRCVPLGRMDYQCLATPQFVSRWFPHGVEEQALRRAPAVTFNRKDLLHCRFAALWGVEDNGFPPHYVPSSSQFVEMIRAGHAYGMVPHPQGNPLLHSGELIPLAPHHAVPVSLYWHHWNLGTSLLEELSETLVQGCRKHLL
ncbi:LysR family transcriptional regulator ArgP [Desulfovibrio psychrotolerans]|uniref:LysR family transcriptional regulator n=1 Tax=Desulfovibrio psychrotolerans TaxID=415242 RepID=A0A7J0BVU9_9BACT|nr:LysR family transcriptional regulator ArgP [Desulfovibrio psychrotolerans]GFM37837.1 LysR family transcriptional regulator [Desulfovibrio psychrotolerans]